MPIHLPPVASAIVTILGVVVAITRLLTASRPFWAAFPAWLQKGLPAALVALGLLPTALEHATSWLDVAQAVILAIGAWYTASRGDRRPPIDPDGGPRIDRTNSEPKLSRNELEPPISIRPPGGMDAECRALPAPRLALLFVLAPLGLQVLACSSLPTKPPCNEERLRAIDAAYIARVTALCLPKYDKASDCPEFPALQADHRRELREECPAP
jgi:hypothetical protein